MVDRVTRGATVSAALTPIPKRSHSVRATKSYGLVIPIRTSIAAHSLVKSLEPTKLTRSTSSASVLTGSFSAAGKFQVKR